MALFTVTAGSFLPNGKLDGYRYNYRADSAQAAVDAHLEAMLDLTGGRMTRCLPPISHKPVVQVDMLVPQEDWTDPRFTSEDV